MILGETRTYSFERITQAIRLISAGSRFIATNPDNVGPTPDGPLPATGAVAALISRATGVDPYYVGKPNPLMMRSALNAIDAHSETTAMIGDRMDTDVVAGIEAGLETILVMTGVTHAGRGRALLVPAVAHRRVGRGPDRGARVVAMPPLDGRVALVTGASGGIGAAVARSLHDAGASVGMLSRRGEDLGLERGLGIACDVRDRDAVARATEQVVERFGRLDIAVANAGVGAYGPFLELDPDDLEAMIDVNLKGTLYTAAATLPHLIASGAGDFVSLASVAGVRAFLGEAVYNASKFGQVGFTRALDLELREHGVRATSIAPGGVNTEFAIGTGREHGDPALAEMMSAEDVAEVVLFAVTRPRNLRILTTTFRPMSEGSAG